MKKQMLAVLLTICMIFTMVPTGALAEATPLPEPAIMDDSASPSSFPEDPLALKMLAGVVSTEADLVAALEAGASGDVTLGGDISDITTQLNVGRDVILDLNGHKLNITLSTAKGWCANGIKIGAGVTLTIRDSSTSSTGTLTVSNEAVSSATDGNGAAINTTGSTLVIESGTVTAKGAYQGAGIGGGLYGDGGTVIISGGTVTATGGDNAAGIGGGSGGSGGVVTIDSGTVTAIGGSTGAGIGGGNKGVGSLQVTVNGGEIMATGGYNGDGIGGAGEYQSDVVNITINGGKVTAAGGQNAAGIGGAKTSSTYCRITVNGGEVIATGGDNAAGIGGVPDGQGSIVAINGGAVTANGGVGAAGIGGGLPYRSCGTVTITGGVVTATGKYKTGGLQDYSAAGIGGGGSYSRTDHPISVSISGGTVIATGSSGAAGIGGGATLTNGKWSYLQPGSLTITGGSVKANNRGQSNAPVPKNEADQTLYLATLSVAEGSIVLFQFPNTSHVVKPENGNYAYGTKDLKTDFGGKVYFWLPPATYAIALKVGKQSFANNAVTVATGSGGTADLASMTKSTPIDILLSGSSVARNAALGTAIGTLSTIDLGGDPRFTYTLVTGEGSDHNHLFSIDNDVLKLSSTLDSAIDSPLRIRVKTTYVLGASYEKTLSLQILDLPGAPSISKLMVNNGAVVIEITPPASDGGSPITEYTVTAYPEGATKTSTTPTVQFDGLTCGVAYTFTVTATNSVGTGPASAESGSIVPKRNQTITFSPTGNIDIFDPSGESRIYYQFDTSSTLSASSDSGLPVTLSSEDENIAKITDDGRLIFLKAGAVDVEAYQAGNNEYYDVRTTQKIEILPVPPGPPTIREVTAEGPTAIISFIPPAFTGGGNITGYTVKSSPENLTASGSNSPITVKGLKVGTTYTFTVTAHVNWLTGPESDPSSEVTPIEGHKVTSVSVPADKTYGMHQNLDFTVNFSQAVIVTGAPRLELTIGSETCFAQYLSGSGKSGLTFRYTVATGQKDSDGIAVGTLDLNGGTIQDAVGNDANLTLNNVGSTSGVRVDGVAPAAPTIALLSSSDSGMSSSDRITNDTTPTLTGTAEAGSIVTLHEGATAIGSTTTDASGNWSVTASALSDGVHAISAKAEDAVGNVSAASAVLTITVDTQAPNFSVMPADGATDISIKGNIVLTFTEGMDALTPGKVQLDGTPRAGTWSAGNAIYKVPYSKLVASKSYTLTITDFRDIAGNTMAADVTHSFTTGASAPAGGGYGNSVRTLTDVPTGLTVSGALSRGAALLVNSFTPARNTTDPALAAIRTRMDSLTETLVFCADITVSGNYTGRLTLSFEVGEQYNGQTVTLLHAKNGKLTTYTAVVKGGIAIFTVTSLSPFALFAPVTPLDVLDIPKTGDGGVSHEAIAVFCMVTLIGGVTVVHSRRRYKR